MMAVNTNRPQPHAPVHPTMEAAASTGEAIERRAGSLELTGLLDGSGAGLQGSRRRPNAPEVHGSLGGFLFVIPEGAGTVNPTTKIVSVLSTGPSVGSR
jgi:hypothetical protein